MKKVLEITWVVVICVGQLTDLGSGECIWYDECGTDPFTGKTLNCRYDGPPKRATEDDIALLQDICPYYDRNQTEFCCSSTQLRNIAKGFGVIASLLGRCPSCLYNFKQTFCDLACSPDQSSFMSVKEELILNGYNGQNVSLVKALTLNVSKEFATQVYDSCKHVVNPSTSGSVLELMCGSWGPLCTPQRFFSYLGDPSNQNTPIKIHFNLWSEADPTRPFLYNRSTVTCDQVAPNQKSSCSCTDCERACQSPDFYEAYNLPNEDGQRFFLLGLMFGCIGVFLFVTSLFIAFLCLRKRSQIYPMMSSGDTDQKESVMNAASTGLNSFMADLFYRWGLICATHPLTIMAVAFALVIVASAGSMFIQIETDPVELWSSRNSRSRVEKDFFEAAFQPFFRVQQVILKPKFNQSFLYKNLFDEEILVGSAFQPEFMLKTLSLLKAIQGITAGDGTTLADVCHKPLSPDSQECNIQSIWAYWQDDPFKFNLHGINPDTQHNDTYLDHFLLCARNPTLQEDQTAMKLGCMSKGGVPVQPVYVLGGFDSTKEPNGHGAEEFTNPTALIITILLNNNRNDTSQAMAWEKEFVDFMLAKIEEESDFVDITFNSERSIQDELERSSLGDLGVILISYSTMLVYIMISLGKVYSWRTLFVDIKVTLSLIGTIGVLLAISSAIGMLGFIGVPTTLVIFQILPFLILAVGVDNIFILVNTAQLIKEDTQKDVIEVVGLTLSRVGPSMLMSTVAQVTAFCLGSISDMPAVRSFSLYAAVSLAWNFLLQMSIFIGALCLDLKRQHAQRADVFCCLQRNPREPLAISDSEGLFQRFWSTLYVPFLFAPIVRTLVVVLFAAWTCASVWLIPQIRIGLEQEIAMPDDSHVLKYLNALKTDLSVGPPLYFVVNRTRSDSPFNFALGESQNKVCGGRGCNSDGLQAQIKLWSRRPQLTRLATPAQSWIDDFFSWAQYCCKHDGTGQTCTGTSDSGNEYGDYGIYGDYGSYGDYDSTEASRCEPCVSQGDRPSSDLFGLLVTRFLAQNPDANCPKAGKAAYRHALNLRALPNESVEVDASSFFAFHTVLRDSDDFTEALRWSRRLADNLTSMLNTPQDQGVAVFAYSIFYVFYEQYLTMWTDTCWSLSLAIGAVFLVILVMTGLDLFSAVAIIVTILLTLINLGGLMVVLGIGLNAISLVNMIMTVGVGVEFSSHLVQAFRIHAAPTGIERSRAALIEWGPTLFSGVHLTNAIGVVILALSKSQIFHVYFFQMYMSIVLLGMLHGMVLLPVILSFWGPEPQGKP